VKALPIPNRHGPPSSLYIETTSECNLRCKHCHFWLTREPEGTLSTSEKVALIRDFASWSVRPLIVMTGGEPMQKKEEFYAIGRVCRELGANSAANTNATLIEPDDVDRIIEDGPRYLILSLDSHRPEVHDYIRGMPGTFNRVVQSIRRLVERRAASRCDTRVLSSLVVCDLNYRELCAYVDYVLALGVDGVLFQMLGPTFALGGARDTFFGEPLPRDISAFDDAIDELAAEKARGTPIVTSDGDLRWMKLYVRNPEFMSIDVCGSHERNMMVDMFGEVQLCFYMRSLTGGRTIGNVRHATLRSLWESEFSTNVRGIMSACRKNCGMLNCHRRPNT
jgi:MoaA/NifB/PqqE/SkfB family radical SAM enzyme